MVTPPNTLSVGAGVPGSAPGGFAVLLKHSDAEGRAHHPADKDSGRVVWLFEGAALPVRVGTVGQWLGTRAVKPTVVTATTKRVAVRGALLSYVSLGLLQN